MGKSCFILLFWLLFLLKHCTTGDSQCFFDCRAITYQELVAGPNLQVKQQKTLQSTGTGAALGDATGDNGTITSDQKLNVNTNDQGTNVQASSHENGEGTNIHVSGSSQAKSRGQSSNQGLISNSQIQPAVDSDPDKNLVTVSSVNRIRNPTRRFIRKRTLPSGGITAQQESELQTDGGTVAIGDGTVEEGSVTSSQDSSLNTNEEGSVAQSTSVGQGNGLKVKVNGAAQAESNGQSSDQSGFSRPIVNGQLLPDGMNVGSFGQREGQSNGKGGSTGEATVDNGSASSVQDANVETNAQGTNVRASSVGRASGNKIRLSGAASASSSGDGARQSFVSNENFNGNNNNNNDNDGFQPRQNQNGFFGNRPVFVPTRGSRMFSPNMNRFSFFPLNF